MASELELEIQQHLAAYLDKRSERYELEDWLIPTLWDLAESNDGAARELAGRIENLISEHSRGDRSPESLREELTRIALPFALSLTSVDSFDIHGGYSKSIGSIQKHTAPGISLMTWRRYDAPQEAIKKPLAWVSFRETLQATA